MGQLEHSVRLLKIFNVIVTYYYIKYIYFIKEDYQQVYVYILIFTSTIYLLSISLSLFQPPTSSPFQLVLLIR